MPTCTATHRKASSLVKRSTNLGQLAPSDRTIHGTCAGQVSGPLAESRALSDSTTLAWRQEDKREDVGEGELVPHAADPVLKAGRGHRLRSCVRFVSAGDCGLARCLASVA